MSTPFIPVTAGFRTGSLVSLPAVGVRTREAKKEIVFHNIAQVRQNEGMSIDFCAKRLGISVQEAKEQEKPSTDLTASQLRAWKNVLKVPYTEILGMEDDDLDDPIRHRAQFLKIMKSAKSIRKHTREERIRAMADSLIGQIVELAPGYEKIAPWNDVGQSHEARPLGVMASRRFDPGIARMMDH